jgi:L-ascorbate metabolism protein UlaG (beta-lactamase superfamily)
MIFSLLPDNLDMGRSRCTARESTMENARALLLDNGIFRLSILPEYGGRICSLFYRPHNLELLATEFRHGPHKTFSVHGGWCAAFPSMLADGEQLSHAVWDAEITELCDERVCVRQWCLIDRVSHMLEGQVRATPCTILVERFVRLVAGEPAVTVEDVLTNRGAWPLPTTWASSLSLRARAGDRVVVPGEAVEVQRGVGPSGNELDFGLLVSTPYQAMARNLDEGWLGFRPAGAPIDLRLSFPAALLPHVVIIANRDEQHPGNDAFRLQPIATTVPIAEDTRGNALVLPPKEAVALPLRLEVGSHLLTAGDWSRPGLALAQMIIDQRVQNGRLAVWRVGEQAVVLKTPRYLALLMPDLGEEPLLAPEDLPPVDVILFGSTPPRELLRRFAERTRARLVGPAALRQRLLADGVGENRSVALSPGARFDLAGLGILATPARRDGDGEELGFLVQADNLSLYHTGLTQFLGDFGPIGETFHPQLVLLPLAGMSMNDAVHAARQLRPRSVLPLGDDDAERDFLTRCRDQHMPFTVHLLRQAEGRTFDGWHVRAME